MLPSVPRATSFECPNHILYQCPSSFFSKLTETSLISYTLTYTLLLEYTPSFPNVPSQSLYFFPLLAVESESLICEP